MFTDDELEGCPSVWVEEWLERNEERVRAAVESVLEDDRLRQLLALLFKLESDRPKTMA